MSRSLLELAMAFEVLEEEMKERDKRADWLAERIQIIESELKYMKSAKQPHREPIRIPAMPRALLSLGYGRKRG